MGGRRQSGGAGHGFRAAPVTCVAKEKRRTPAQNPENSWSTDDPRCPDMAQATSQPLGEESGGRESGTFGSVLSLGWARPPKLADASPRDGEAAGPTPGIRRNELS